MTEACCDVVVVRLWKNGSESGRRSLAPVERGAQRAAASQVEFDASLVSARCPLLVLGSALVVGWRYHWGRSATYRRCRTDRRVSSRGACTWRGACKQPRDGCMPRTSGYAMTSDGTAAGVGRRGLRGGTSGRGGTSDYVGPGHGTPTVAPQAEAGPDENGRRRDSDPPTALPTTGLPTTAPPTAALPTTAPVALPAVRHVPWRHTVGVGGVAARRTVASGSPEWLP